MAKKRQLTAFNDGIADIYGAHDAADGTGGKAVETLTFKRRVRYCERMLGIGRYMEHRQFNLDVHRVIRCPYTKGVTAHDIVMTEDGVKYAILMVQSPPEIIPRVMDLTLSAVDERWDYEP